MAATPIGAFVYNTSLISPFRPAKAVGTTTDATNGAVVAGNFVKFSTLAAGALSAVVTDSVTVWGFATTSAKGTSPEPYTAPYKIDTAAPSLSSQFTVDVHDVLNTQFVVNLITAGALPVIGTAYELNVTSGVPYIDTAATTNLFFRVEGLYPGDSSADTNPRYICSVVATRQ